MRKEFADGTVFLEHSPLKEIRKGGTLPIHPCPLDNRKAYLLHLLGQAVIQEFKALINKSCLKGFRLILIGKSIQLHLSQDHIPVPYLEPVKQQLIADFFDVVSPDAITIYDDLAIIAVVGRGMVRTEGTAARVFTALSRAHINIRMIDQGSCELNIIIGVDADNYQRAICAIYEEFTGQRAEK